MTGLLDNVEDLLGESLIGNRPSWNRISRVLQAESRAIDLAHSPADCPSAIVLRFMLCSSWVRKRSVGESERGTDTVLEEVAKGFLALARPFALVPECSEVDLLSSILVKNYSCGSKWYRHVIDSLGVRLATLGSLQILDLIFSIVTTSKPPIFCFYHKQPNIPDSLSLLP